MRRTRGTTTRGFLCLALVLLLGISPGAVLAGGDGAVLAGGDGAVLAGGDGSEITDVSEEVFEAPEPGPGVEEESTPEPTETGDLVSGESGDDEPAEPSAEPTESVGAAGENGSEATYANSISGLLWLDMYDDTDNGIYAGDSTRQSGEQPLAGYTVGLFKESDLTSAVQTASTGADGKYEFSNLEPGSYVVGVKTETMNGVEYLLPFWYLDGTEGDNRFVATYDEATDAYLYAYTAPITIAEATVVTDMDAGIRTVPGIDPMAIHSQTFTVTGTLLSPNGYPMVNATVYLSNSYALSASGGVLNYSTPVSQGSVTTDANGTFTITGHQADIPTPATLWLYVSGQGAVAFEVAASNIIYIGLDASIAVAPVTSSFTYSANPTSFVYNGSILPNNGFKFKLNTDDYVSGSVQYFSLLDALTGTNTTSTTALTSTSRLQNVPEVAENYLDSNGAVIQTATGKGFVSGGTYSNTPPSSITFGGATYTYAGYRVDATTGTLQTGTPSFIVTSNHTVNYYYTRTVTVSFVPQNGNSPSTTPYTDTDAFGTLPTVTYAGFNFVGWFTKAEGGIQVSSADIVGAIFPSGVIGSLYAQWVPAITVTEHLVDEVSGGSLGNNVLYIPTANPYYTHSGIATDFITAFNHTFMYLGYRVGSYSSGDPLLPGTPSALYLSTNPTNIYYIYHMLDTTISVTLPTTMDFHVDETTYPDVEAGTMTSPVSYYAITNNSEYPLNVAFGGMTAINDAAGLTFVADAAASTPGSSSVSLDLNLPTAAPPTTNAFTSGVSNIVPLSTYTTVLGTLDGDYIHSSSGPISKNGYITLGGFYAGTLSSALKNPQITFTFTFSLVTG